MKFSHEMIEKNVGLLIVLDVGPPLADSRTFPVLLLHVLANAIAVPFAARIFAVAVGPPETPDAPRGGLRFDAGAPLR